MKPNWKPAEDRRLPSVQSGRTAVVNLVPDPREGIRSKAPDPKERRRYPRIKKKVPVRHRLISKISSTEFDDLGRKVAHGYTRDFSHRGICIKTGKKIPPGTILELVIEFPEQPVKAVAKVCWSRDIDKPGEFYAGMEYIAVADDQLNLMTQMVAESLIESYEQSGLSAAEKLKQTLMNLFSKAK